jgi:hypothetical protein
MTTDRAASEASTSDIVAITQLVLLERESRDLGRWARMRRLFHPDSLIRVSWFTGNGSDFVDGSIDMARRGVLAKHRLGPILVRLNEDRAVATLGAAIDIPAEVNGVQAQLSSHARFLYRVERREGTWRISGFDAVYVRDELAPSAPGDSLPVKAADVAHFRTSYRMLSFVLSSQGYTVNPNLPGDDRPDLVEKLERELFGWAGLDPND